MVVAEPLPVNIPLAVERLGLETETVHELVCVFFREAPRQIRYLQRALTKMDMIALERLAHSLKGTSSSLCIDRICLRASQLETLAHEHQLDCIPRVLAALQTEVRTLGCYLADLHLGSA